MTDEQKRFFVSHPRQENEAGTIGGAVAQAIAKKESIAVLGFGISNRPLVALLHSMGAQICVYDAKPCGELGEQAELLATQGVIFVQREEEWLAHHPAVIFRSPGIRPDMPAIVSACARGARLTCEMEWFLEQTPATVIGITGSDGKSTTTTLTALMLEAAGQGKVFLGGNLGTPLLRRLPEMTERDFAVVELSSFQLSTPCCAPCRAAITNVTPNHLNWHTDMEEYIQAKTNIYNHSLCRRFVANAENTVTRELAARHVQKGNVDVVLFSSADRTPAEISSGIAGADVITCRDGMVVYFAADGTETELLSAADILLPGRHNLENVMTAAALVWGLVPVAFIAQVARTFGGVEHRLERVRTLCGVTFYNSSIDSSPTRTAAALSALPRHSAVVICGGYDKHIPFAPLAEVLCDRAAAVVLTGATRQAILTALECCPAYRPAELRVEICAEFSDAVAVAAALGVAGYGENVLLSPACASFDAFVNFEERGRVFKEIVRAMQEEDLMRAALLYQKF